MESIKTLTGVLMKKLTSQDRTHLRYIKKKAFSDLPAEILSMSFQDVLTAIDNTKVLGGKAFKQS